MLHVCVVYHHSFARFSLCRKVRWGMLHGGQEAIAENHGIIASGGAQGRDQEKEGFRASWVCTGYIVWPRNSPALCITLLVYNQWLIEGQLLHHRRVMSEGGGARENQREVYWCRICTFQVGGGDHGGIWKTMHCRLCMDCYGTVMLGGGGCIATPNPHPGSVTINARR